MSFKERKQEDEVWATKGEKLNLTATTDSFIFYWTGTIIPIVFQMHIFSHDFSSLCTEQASTTYERSESIWRLDCIHWRLTRPPALSLCSCLCVQACVCDSVWMMNGILDSLNSTLHWPMLFSLNLLVHFFVRFCLCRSVCFFSIAIVCVFLKWMHLFVCSFAFSYHSLAHGHTYSL